MTDELAVNSYRVSSPRGKLVQAVVALLLLAAVAVYLFMLVLAARTIRQPFLGAFVEPTLVVNRVGRHDWNGRAAGLDFPDHVVALDGQPLVHPTSLYDRLARYEAGDVVTVTVESQDGEHHRVLVELQSFPSLALIGFFLFPYGIGLAYLVIGLVVYVARRERPAARAFAIFCVSSALAAGMIFDLYTTHRFARVFVIGLSLLGGSLIHLTLLFPRRSTLIERWPWLSWLGYLPSGILASWALIATSNLDDPWAYIPAWRMLYLYSAACVLLWMAVLMRRRLRSESALEREQTRLVLLGLLVGSLPVVSWWIWASLRAGRDFQPTILFATVVLVPLSTGYVIVRQRLVDVDSIISRSLSYGVLALLIIGSYWLLTSLVSWLLGTPMAANNPVVVAVFVVGLTMVFNPLRRLLYRSTDRFFYRDRVDYGQALESYSRDLARLLNKNDIFAALTDQIEEAVHPQKLQFFLFDKPAGQYAPFSGSEAPARGVRFSPRGGLARRLTVQHQTVYLIAGQSLPEDLIFEADHLEALGASLYLPLPEHGWMAVGDKRSGELYTQEELDYLEGLADHTSLALARVELISDLERKVSEMNALRWISQATHFTVGLEDLLELIYAQSGRVLDTTNFYIALYDEAKGTLSFAFYVENGERYYPTDEWPLEMGGLQSEIIRHGQPIVTDDYLSECLERGIAPGGKAGRAWMGVPLNVGERVIGVMNVSSSEPGVSYSRDQLSIFSAIADQAAAIIEKARLDAEMEERARQLAVLNEVGSAINSSLDLQIVLQVIINKATEILEAEAGSLSLMDEETEELVFKVAVGPSADDLVGMRLAPGTGIVGRTAQTQEPIIVNDTQKEEGWFRGTDDSIGYITRSILSVPLVHKKKSIGVLQVLNKTDGSPFDEQDKQLMMAFASQAAAALENARLFTLTDQALAARVEELSMFQKIDRALNATLDYEHVIELTLDWAMRMTGVQVGAVFALDEEKGGLFIVVSRGYPSQYERYREHPLPVSEGILGRAVRTGETVIVRDASKDPDYVRVVPETRSQLVLPLRLGERVIGVISLESPERNGFGKDDIQFAIRLAERAVVPIENAQLYEQVKRANEAKSQFVSMVAHELKIPMTSIKGYARLLELSDGPVDETERGFIKTINANVDRMTKTVNDLLDISRIETGRLKLEMGEVSIPSVIDETLASLQSAIEDKGLGLTLNVPADLPLVWGDRSRLVQVLINLLSNATKYTIEGRIHIEAEAVESNVPDNGHSGRFVRCSVSDTGIGISREDQERLFKSQFVRFENAVDVAPGHGLGLWLVNQLAQLQGGEITFQSELGKGSTFSVSVPVAEKQTRGSD